MIITACARLPLALGIAAARARQSGFPLAALATELGVVGQPLDALDAGDLTSDVRTVFSWSITALTLPAARLFRVSSYRRADPHVRGVKDLPAAGGAAGGHLPGVSRRR